MLILLHSSKTMRPPTTEKLAHSQPVLLSEATELAANLKALTAQQIAVMMKISPKLASTTYDLIQAWTTKPAQQRPAIDSFLGDIYSGLQVAAWSDEDRMYADQHLRILSGLYGVLRPLDGVFPYRLEMGYRLPAHTMYDFWQSKIADALPPDDTFINLAAAEYSRTVTPYISGTVITPKFMTTSPKTGNPTFVVVHAKIARGAFAHWLIKRRVSDPEHICDFKELNYRYDKQLSTPQQPVFVCKTFGGLGLSVRLT